MLFCIVRALASVKLEDHADLDAALKAAGLQPGKVDFGTVSPTHGIVVDEFGLVKDPAEQRYFTIGGRLFAGDAVVYQFNEAGETVDCAFLYPGIRMLLRPEDIEQEIAAGRVQRPVMSVNGEVFWRWPDPSGHPEGA